jgi:phosphoribosylformylglycinamidine cyclo-ligase
MRDEQENPYVAAGVDYAVLDAGKRLALSAAIGTSDALLRLGGRAIDRSRGEPAFVFALGESTLAFVLEGLGTKSVIARQYKQLTGEDHFAAVAYDTVAAILNDLCCVGALPLVVNAYFATGSGEWYGDPERLQGLVSGWRQACDDADCVWGGGESPTLPGLVAEEEIELAGAAVGVMPGGQAPLLGEELAAGDEIVLVRSSGLHANGASLVRRVATQLPEGLLTRLPSGTTLGAATLTPSVLYVGLVRELLAQGLPVTYLSHITGHGLLKLMRPRAQLTYRIGELPPVPEALAYIVEASGMDAPTAYSTLNMGSGFAVYCRGGHGVEVSGLAQAHGYDAVIAGAVEQGPRRVILESVGVSYQDEDLNLSPPDPDEKSA